MHPRELKEAYDRGENIAKLLKRIGSRETNSEEIIEVAYDLQAGSYIEALQSPEMLSHKKCYGKAVAEEILNLTSPSSLMEAGVGEGTTLSFVLDQFENTIPHTHGFDISWSRIACCRSWLMKSGHPEAFLSVASILHIPYVDSCFDVVYTSHTIEPNGGKEAEILAELYRVASRFLILLEPAYELAEDRAKRRMEEHGYCRGLVAHAEAMGMRVLRHEIFSQTADSLNPTAITIIEKNSSAEAAAPRLACPKFREPLEINDDSFFCPSSLNAYPRILGIPCLRPEDAVVASRYNQEMD